MIRCFCRNLMELLVTGKITEGRVTSSFQWVPIYWREDVMPRIHSHLRSGKRRSLQVPNLRTSKDYLYRRVSGQSAYWQKEFATSVLD